MSPACPHILRIEHHSDHDRYGNPRRSVVVWSAVPMDPHAYGYDAASAAAVLQAARWHKSCHPDAEVRIESACQHTPL